MNELQFALKNTKGKSRIFLFMGLAFATLFGTHAPKVGDIRDLDSKLPGEGEKENPNDFVNLSGGTELPHSLEFLKINQSAIDSIKVVPGESVKQLNQLKARIYKHTINVAGGLEVEEIKGEINLDELSAVYPIKSALGNNVAYSIELEDQISATVTVATV